MGWGMTYKAYCPECLQDYLVNYYPEVDKYYCPKCKVELQFTEKEINHDQRRETQSIPEGL